jgi:hypothetical protein
MNTQESTAGIIWKMNYFTLLAILFFSLVTIQTYAQKASKKSHYRVKLADCDSPRVPLKTILANPKFTTNYPGCEIVSYSISFAPDGGNYFGPFGVKGSDIPENNVNFLREFTTTKVKIFIDEVHLKCNGKDSLISPYYFISIP